MGSDEGSHLAKRLAPDPSPACWTGVCVKVVPAGSHDEAGAVVHTPDHFLAAAWPPGASGWTRWPEAVVIGSPTSMRALAELFRHLPPEAKLYLASMDDVDAALAADILLAADRNLEPYQRDAIARFSHAARDRTQAAIAGRYTDRDAGFERFRAVVVGADHARNTRS